MSRQLRTLLASPSDALTGGAARSVVELAVALAADGRIRPVVAVPREGEVTAALDDASIEWVAVASPRWVSWTPNGYGPTPLRSAIGRARQIASIARHLGPWISLARRTSADVIVTCSAATPAPALGARFHRVAHIWWVQEFVTLDHGLSYAIGESMSQRAMGVLSSAVVANSAAVAAHFARHIPKLGIRVIPLAVEGFAATPNRVRVGMARLLLLGHQTSSKGTDLAVRAVAQSRELGFDVRLRLVGSIEPQYRADLERLISGLGVEDAVELVPFTGSPSVHIDWCNALLMCSRNEAFGRVTVEALKSGRPVIGSRSGGTVDIVRDGIDGLLFEPGNVTQLSAAITRLCNEPDLVTTMSSAAIAGTRDRFTMAGEVDGFVDALEAARR